MSQLWLGASWSPFSAHVIEELPDALDGERADRVVSMLTGLSRSAASRAIEGQHVTVDGRPVAKGSQRLTVGQVLAIADDALIDDPRPNADPSVDVRLTYVDDDVIVVDKDPGSVVHPGAGNSSGTIVQGLLARYPEIANVGDLARPGVVHRLDKGTTGVFVVARNELAYESLTLQLRERTVERQYVTLGWGEPATRKGVIEAPLGRAVRDPTRIVVREDGKVARTRYEVLARWEEPRVSLFGCSLDTGRTHQIRVHLEAIGHHVVGDSRYGGGRDPLGIDRPALHARSLGFRHPRSGEWVHFESPIPGDMESLFDRLGSPSEGSLPAQ